jgi:O-antigen ligase
MEVTPIGLILLIAGPLMMMRPSWLYAATIFLLPFTATDLINVGSGDNASGLQASMYLGSLLILRRSTQLLLRGKISIPNCGKTALVWLGLFIAVTVISLSMPIWIDGRVQIPSPYLFDFTSQPLYLSSHNITGVLYMIYGFVFSFIIATLNQRPELYRRTLRIFLAGSVFAALWGAMEFACKFSGVPYPAMIFNTGTSLSAQGYKEVLMDGTFRISSVAVEPSILAQSLLIAVAVYLPYIFTPLVLFERTFDRIFFCILVVVLCLTTSSTAYLGFAIILALALFLLCLRRLLQPKHILIFAIIPASAVLVVMSTPIFWTILDAQLFSKASGSSAAERLMTINNSYEMFVQYPILGIGWASITSHDLIMNILANSGTLGLFTFGAGMYAIFRALYRSIKSRPATLKVQGLMRPDFGLYIALGVTLATSVIAGFPNTFSFFWFIVGLAIAASNQRNNVTAYESQRAPSPAAARNPSIKPLPC